MRALIVTLSLVVASGCGVQTVMVPDLEPAPAVIAAAAAEPRLGGIAPAAAPRPRDCLQVLRTAAAGQGGGLAFVDRTAAQDLRFDADSRLPVLLGDGSGCRVAVDRVRPLETERGPALREVKLRSSYPSHVEAKRNPAREKSRLAKYRKVKDPELDLLGQAAHGLIALFDGVSRARVPETVERQAMRVYSYNLEEFEAVRRVEVDLRLLDAAGATVASTTAEVEAEALIALSDDRHPGDKVDQHSAGALPMTAVQWRDWRDAAPTLKQSALLRAFSNGTPLLTAKAGQPRTLAELSVVEPAAAPARGRADHSPRRTTAAPARPALLAPLVEAEGVAFWAAPRLLVTAARLPEDAGLVRLRLPGLGESWTLLEARDASSGLILLRANAMGDALPLATGTRAAAQVDAPARDFSPGTPLLQDGRVVAVAGPNGRMIPAGEVEKLLELSVF